MKNFDLKSYWNKRYISGGNSGIGSYANEAFFKADYINDTIENYSIKSITELGVGDGNNLSYYRGFDRYCGYDISPEAIRLCTLRSLHEILGLNYYFTSDMNKIDYQADMCMCLDVIFHQVGDDDYNDLLRLMFEVGNFKYVLIYATNHNNNSLSAPHVKHREFMKDINERYPNRVLLDIKECNLSEKKIMALYYNNKI